MIVWPVVERELRLRARAPATHWTRLALVLAGAAACLPQLLWSAALGRPDSLGRTVFNGIIIAGFLTAGSAFILTADAVTRERREGTLGLLLLTRVRTWDILLGKLASSGLTGLCGLVAFLPVLMIPVLAGGVTGGEVFRKGLVLLATLFFSLAAGLWGSALAPDRSQAWAHVVFLMLCVVLCPLASQSGGSIWFRISPIQALMSASEVEYRAAPLAYWSSLAGMSVVSCALFFWSGLRLRKYPSEDLIRSEAPIAKGVLPKRRKFYRVRQNIVR